MRPTFVAIFTAVALSAIGCGSKCDDACAVLADPNCGHFNPGGIDVTSAQNCADDCKVNHDSVCKNNSDDAKNSAVLDCVAGVTCGPSALQQLELCVSECPNANR